MTQRSVVVATAGHVDHGKSTLVRALTGMDPDRLQAERERGLTIELGFTWADFAGTTIAFVDVPGHEKFITTMLSGVGSVPLALFAVAADDPWMPQAAEHLAALDALGTREAIFAITRCDLADPGAAMDRVREEIAGTSLAGARVLPVSAVTGEGMAPLREALADLGAAAPQADVAADVRVWIDRRFTVAGAGTVVTGTLPAGVIAAGAELRGPGGSVRVRSLESLNAPRDRVTGSTRVALNLTGAVEGLGRGDALWQPGAWHLTDVVDVRLLTGAGRVPRTPMWHIGSRATQVRMQLLDDSHARLALPDPVPLRQGDRTVLRDPGDRRLWGALVVDPDPAPLRSLARRSGLRPRLARARELRARGAEPDLEVEVRARGVVHRDTLRRLGIRTEGPSPWRMSPAWQEEASTRIAEIVRRHDHIQPLNPGLAPAEIAHALAGYGLRVPAPELIADLLPRGLRIEEGKVTSRSAALPPEVEAALAELLAQCEQDPLRAPTLEQIREAGLSDAHLAAAARLGRIFLPAPGVVLPADAARLALHTLRTLPQPFTTSEARKALGTSRRVAIPILEFLDRARATRRLADDRREVR